MNDDEYARGLAKIIKMNEDEVRTLIIQASPDIRHDMNVMTDLLRDLVKVERAKLGLDKHTGKLLLTLNKDKTPENRQPDLLGTGQVAGRRYEAAAWISKNGIEIVLSEPMRH